MFRDWVREVFAEATCDLSGHLLVDPFSLPDPVVKHLSFHKKPDAICLRCQRIFEVEPIFNDFQQFVGFRVRRIQ